MKLVKIVGIPNRDPKVIAVKRETVVKRETGAKRVKRVKLEPVSVRVLLRLTHQSKRLDLLRRLLLPRPRKLLRNNKYLYKT
jgi:hypothetical protein